MKILLNPLGGPKRGCAGWRDHWGRLGFNDGWLDNFLVNGTAFGLPPKGPRPTCFRNNRDGTRTEITKKGRIHLLGLGPRLLRARLRQTDSLTCLSRIGATIFSPVITATARLPMFRRKQAWRGRDGVGVRDPVSWTTIATATLISSSPTTSISIPTAFPGAGEAAYLTL